MNLYEIKNSLFYYILEGSLSWWKDEAKKAGSRITNSRMAPQNVATVPENAKLDLPNGILTVSVETALIYGKWDDRPDYDPKVVKPGTPGEFDRYDPDEKKMYEVSVHWENWKEILTLYMQSYIANRKFFVEDPDTHIKYTKKKLLNYLLEEADVRFHCTCPAFWWQGFHTELHKMHSALKPPTYVRTGPKKREPWIPKHKAAGMQAPMCKHMKRVLLDLGDIGGYLYKKIYKEMQKEDVYYKVMLKIFGQTALVSPTERQDFLALPPPPPGMSISAPRPPIPIMLPITNEPPALPPPPMPPAKI